MDNDAAHHANIALHMYLSGNYVNLVDNGHDYLDKPHLHFWLAAVSYKLFGVNSFAYRFPSFLFTILGTWSVYKLGFFLYNKETGKLAALVVATAFGYILANTDVRMDAILTACVIFSTWQGIIFLYTKKLLPLVATALALALGFSTKGHIAILVPFIGLFIYIIQKKYWQKLFDAKWLLLVFLFFLFITPVVFCYYLQYDLHPEKTIRGQTSVSGVKFILWNQSLQRFKGDSFGGDGGNDYLFFIHSFLWAFAPWSILSFLSIFYRIKNHYLKKKEWLTAGTFLGMLLLITFAGFKLPHYLTIIFPVAAIITASFITSHHQYVKWAKVIFKIQLSIVLLIIVIIVAINIWAFPVQRYWVVLISVLLLALVFYYLLQNHHHNLSKLVYSSVSTMILLFFLLNTNFYPQLLTYQAGNELAKKIKGKIKPEEIYFWKDVYSSSFSFYTQSIRKELKPQEVEKNKLVWVVSDTTHINEIKNQFNVRQQLSHIDFEITKLDFKFLNPQTRLKACSRLFLLQLSKK